MTDSEKVQKEIKKSFSELMLQIKLNQEEINHILQDAVDANNYGKLPEAPISKENLLYNDAYDEIDHHVRKPTLYPDLSDYLSEVYRYTSHNSSIINSNTSDKWGGE
ncbi:MAG: hypothetical protein KTV77_02330 [Wolbachia endosymbiont of Fragariocoptes setiger]|nr:hypothetical protein [Wolbachia endosymbiont of Fragariocoptes setiger]